IRTGCGLAVGPDKGAALPANAPGIAQELAGQGRGGFLVARAFGDAGVNAPGLGVGADSDPSRLLEDPAQQRRTLLADVPVMGALTGLGDAGTKAGVGAQLVNRVKPCNISTFAENGQGGDKPDPRDALNESQGGRQIGMGSHALLKSPFDVLE